LILFNPPMLQAGKVISHCTLRVEEKFSKDV